MSNKIPVFTEGGDFDCMLDEESVRDLLRAGRATIVRDRKGNTRRAVLVASVHHKLSGSSLRQARDSYRGIEKYTYRENFEAAPPCHMLKIYDQRADVFVRWPDAK